MFRDAFLLCKVSSALTCKEGTLTMSCFFVNGHSIVSHCRFTASSCWACVRLMVIPCVFAQTLAVVEIRGALSTGVRHLGCDLVHGSGRRGRRCWDVKLLHWRRVREGGGRCGAFDGHIGIGSIDIPHDCLLVGSIGILEQLFHADLVWLCLQLLSPLVWKLQLLSSHWVEVWNLSQLCQFVGLFLL